MESSSSQSVNPIPSWGNGNRNQSTRSADPMAFFDLIMDSARSSLGQGSKSLDPVAPFAPSTSQQDNSLSSSSDNDQWQDDRHDDPSASYVTTNPTPQDVPSSEEAERSDIDQDDIAAIAELSSDKSDDENSTEEADQAALDTAGSAGQTEQLLGAPDTLDSGEQVKESTSKEVAADDVKKPVSVEQKASQAGETDQPLDTSAETNEGEDEQEGFSTTEIDAMKADDSVKEEDESSTQEVEEVSIEAEPTEATAGTSETAKEREKTDSSVETIAGESETSAADESHAESESRDDSPRGRDDSPQARRKEKQDGPGQPVVSTETTNTSTPAVNQTAQGAEETIVASNATSASGSNQIGSTSGSTSPSTNNITNLASLLQRGLQRGTLQKSTEAKSTPQLDPKQQIRLINRVARAVESTPAGQSIKIRLNPSELGQLKVEIKLEDGNMVAKIEAENPATRQVLLQHLPQLRDRLAESNINVQQFDVDVMGQHDSSDGGTSNLGDQQADSGNSSGSSRQWSPAGSGEEEASVPRAEQVNKEAERESRNLNITI